MHDRLKTVLLKAFKVPSEPEPPVGSPASIRIFRAAPNYYKLRLIKWGLTQAAGLLGIVIFLALDFAGVFRPPLAAILRILEFVGLLGWVIQLPVTYFLVRLDYEMRWYIVTDRSLRIRHGVQSVREITMTFANVQQITLHQGPLQRLLGIADLQVRTAGGGGAGSGDGGTQSHGMGEAMHLGFFRGVNNAAEIRDLILERLRRWRDAGLGDPDDTVEELPEVSSLDREVHEAARELIEETRLLRDALSRS